MDVNTVEKDTDFLRKEATKVKLNKKEPNNEALRNFFKENCQALQYPDPIDYLLPNAPITLLPKNIISPAAATELSTAHQLRH